MGKKQKILLRLAVYALGTVTLALGIVLNTKTGMGTSAIISVPYAIFVAGKWDLGRVTFFFYVFCVLMQWVLNRKDFRVWEWLQLAVSFLTSGCIGIFDRCIPMASGGLAVRFGVLVLAIVATGVGSSLIVMMELVSNPADGLARTVGKLAGREFGFGKNVLDLACVLTAAGIGLLCRGRIVGIGVGTICSAIFIGRCIALTDRLFRWPIRQAAGLVG